MPATADGRHGEAAGERITARQDEIDLDILDDTLSFYLRALGIAVSRDWESRLGGLDAVRGTGRVTALFLIANHPGIRPSVIAEVSMKDRSEMGRVLDGLEANGLICRRMNSTDTRARALFLTEAGEQTVAELRRRVRSSRAFFHDVPDDEYAQVMTLLRKIYWRVLTAHRSEDGDAACQTPA